MRRAIIVGILMALPGLCAGAADKPQAIAADVPYGDPDGADDMRAPAVKTGILPNGSFEEGRYWPTGWDPMDKLSTVWVDGGTDGRKCLRIETTILESQWLPWREKVLKLGKEAAARGKGDPQSVPQDPIPAPPEKLPAKPPYYNTVGGTYGVDYRSDFVKAEPGAIYRLIVDVRSTAGDGKLWVKGFFDEKRKTEDGEQVLKMPCYRAYLNPHNVKGEWQRYVRVFHTARSTSTREGKPVPIEWLQVQIYAYWPPGVYEYDNVRLEIIGYEPIQALPPTEAEGKKPVTAPVDPGDGEFPVIK